MVLAAPPHLSPERISQSTVGTYSVGMVVSDVHARRAVDRREGMARVPAHLGALRAPRACRQGASRTSLSSAAFVHPVRHKPSCRRQGASRTSLSSGPFVLPVHHKPSGKRADKCRHARANSPFSNLPTRVGSPADPQRQLARDVSPVKKNLLQRKVESCATHEGDHIVGESILACRQAYLPSELGLPAGGSPADPERQLARDASPGN